MSTVASYSIKGGVGKTTTAVNLAWVAAQHGHRVLLWDLDPQGAASYCLRVAAKVNGGVKAVLKNPLGVFAHVKASDFLGLDVLPADFSYRRMDILLGNTGKPRSVLRRLLGAAVDEYDLIVLDCAPSISLTTESIFRAADLLLVPLLPSPLSMRTLVQLERHLERKGPRSLRLACFFSMADGRKRLHRDTIAATLGGSANLMRTVIPYASDVESMSVRRAPLPSYAPCNPTSLAYERLWLEVEGVLSGRGETNSKPLNSP